ncbi:transglycosylase family protein [Brevibacterium casei]|uniref:transglycosylase family protein n=1 Tax=Brevibacterium casei TaxID=33889 RepID=UPI00288350C4|nr:transglycosylase family protein [Brevibacterium casei]
MKLLTTHLHRTAALVGAAALASAGLLGAGAPSQADEAKSVWDRVAACESSGDWSINTGNGYYGGLQFSLRTWKAFGGEEMPHEASREEQIRIAQKTLAVQGPGAWPTCGKKAGLTKENGAADDGRADEPKKDEPKDEPKAEEPKDEPKADEPTEEPKNDEPTEEPKADEPKTDEDSTDDEPKQDESKAEEPKSDEPADDPQPEDPKDDDSTTEDESLTETPGSEGAGTDDGADENSSNANDTGLTGHVIDLNK